MGRTGLLGQFFKESLLTNPSPKQGANINNAKPTSRVSHIALEPEDATRLSNLCGHLDSHIHQIAQHYQITIYNRSNRFQLEGDDQVVQRAGTLLEQLYRETSNGTPITPDLIHLLLQEDANDAEQEHTVSPPSHAPKQPSQIKTPQLMVKPRGKHQKEYVERVREFDINFGIGPAG